MLTDDGFGISLNVAVTTVEVFTPVAPLGGVIEWTVGGVMSDPGVVLNTTSTQ